MSKAIVRDRRTVLGVGASMLLLTAAAAGQAKAQELDGELLRLCSDLHACQRRIDDLTSRDVDFDDEMTAWCRIFDEISAIPVRTPEGLRAKASVVELELNLSRIHGELPDASAELAFSLVRDILGRAA